MDKIKIIDWQPKREGKTGVFITRVAEGAAGAKLYEGEKADKSKYSYWGFPVGNIKGQLVWIDKRKGTFGNEFIIALKSKTTGRINSLKLTFDAGSLKDVCNRLFRATQEGEFYTREYEFSYFVYDKKDTNGKPVFKNDKQVISSNVVIKDLKGYYDKDNPLPDKYKWTKQVNGKGEEEWNSLEEIKYWERVIISIQKELLAKGVAVPLIYNSLLCGPLENPTASKQTNEVIENARAIWENTKNNYQFQWMKESAGASADDFDPDAKPEPYNSAPDAKKAENAAATNAQAPLNVVPPNPITVPETDITKMDDSDDLPF